jgi:hypothetical protein
VLSTIDCDGIAEIAYKVGKLAYAGAWVPSRTRLNYSQESNKLMQGPFIDPDLVCATIVLDGQKEQLGLYPVDNDSRIILTNNDVLVHDCREAAHYINTGHLNYTTLILFYRKCKGQKWNITNIFNYFRRVCRYSLHC